MGPGTDISKVCVGPGTDTSRVRSIVWTIVCGTVTEMVSVKVVVRTTSLSTVLVVVIVVPGTSLC